MAKIKADAEALAESMKDVTLTIGAKTSSTGTIFGSVNNIQIAEALEKLGFNVDRKLIVIKETIKEHKRILFNGNGYDESWIEGSLEAPQRGFT